MEEEVLTLPNQMTDIAWTSYLAIGIAEGFEEVPVSKLSKNNIQIAYTEAWAIIIKYKLWKNLQEWFGKNVNAILESNAISKDGTIDWNIVDVNPEHDIAT